MKNTTIIEDNAGFTLLEIMFAMVVLAVGLLGVAAMQLTAIQGNSFGNKLSEATDRIESRMEIIKKMPHDSIQNEEEDMDTEGFTRKTIVQADTPRSGVKTVNVEVSWNDNHGTKNHKIAFHSIIME